MLDLSLPLPPAIWRYPCNLYNLVMEVIMLFLYLRPRQPRTKRDTLELELGNLRQSFIRLWFCILPFYKYITIGYNKFSIDLTLLSFFFLLKILTTFFFQIFNLPLPCVPNRSNRFLTLVTILSRDFLWLFFSVTAQDPEISCRTDFIVFVIKTDRNNSSSSSM